MLDRNAAAAGKPQRSRAPILQLHWAHGVFFVLGGIAAASLLFMATFRGQGSVSRNTLLGQTRLGLPGPWGQIEYTPLELQRPEETLLPPPPAAEPIRWFFEGFTREQVEALLVASDLTTAQRRLLLDSSRWQQAANGWALHPPIEVVRDMSQSARRTIYDALARSDLNVWEKNPFRIATADFPRWLEASRLPADKRALVERLSFIEADTTLFHDVPLLGRLCSAEENRRLSMALSQTRSMMMHLRITADSDIDSLVAYWGRGGRGQTMRPFLESLARVPGGASVSVSYFFPAFARMRLYTYPDASASQAGAYQDCYWTALNFVNEEPDSRFFDGETVYRTLKTGYSEIQTNWTFGDLILLLGEGKATFHCCVYIADDIVFTKNGFAPSAPWMLMRIPDMLAMYASQKKVELVVLRRKATEAPESVQVLGAAGGAGIASRAADGPLQR